MGQIWTKVDKTNILFLLCQWCYLLYELTPDVTVGGASLITISGTNVDTNTATTDAIQTYIAVPLAY